MWKKNIVIQGGNVQVPPRIPQTVSIFQILLAVSGICLLPVSTVLPVIRFVLR